MSAPHRELNSEVQVPGALLLLSSQLVVFVLFCFILSPEAFHQLPLLSLLSKKSADLYLPSI